VRPLQSKLIVAFALGLIALGVLAWISVKPLAPSRALAVASDAAPLSATPRLETNMPHKIVTMVGIPEVIVSPLAASGAVSGSPDSKPSKASRDIEKESSPLPPAQLNAEATPTISARKPVSATPRRSDDNWLVKPE
jgi:hypothetical protein